MRGPTAMRAEILFALGALAFSALALAFSRVSRTVVREALKNFSRKTEITVEGHKVLSIEVKDHLGLSDRADAQSEPPAEG